MNKGDGEGYDPHPGDPWHPTWGDGEDDQDDLAAVEQLEGEDRSGFFKRILGRDVEGGTDDEASSDRLFAALRSEDEPEGDEPEGDEPEQDGSFVAAAAEVDEEVVPDQILLDQIGELGVAPPSRPEETVRPAVLSDVSFDASSEGAGGALWAVEGGAGGHRSDAALEHQAQLEEFDAAAQADLLAGELATAEAAVGETVIDVSAESLAATEGEMAAANATEEAAALERELQAGRSGSDDVLSDEAAGLAADHEGVFAVEAAARAGADSDLEEGSRLTQMKTAMADHAGETASAFAAAQQTVEQAGLDDELNTEVDRARTESEAADLGTVVEAAHQREEADLVTASADEDALLEEELAAAVTAGLIAREHEAVRLGTDDAATSFSVPDVEAVGFEFEDPEPRLEATIDAQTTGPTPPPVTQMDEGDDADASREPVAAAVDDADGDTGAEALDTTDGAPDAVAEVPRRRGWRRWLGIGGAGVAASSTAGGVDDLAAALEETADADEVALPSTAMAADVNDDDATSELPLGTPDDGPLADEMHPVPAVGDVGFEGWLDDPEGPPGDNSLDAPSESPYAGLDADDAEDEIADWVAFAEDHAAGDDADGDEQSEADDEVTADTDEVTADTDEAGTEDEDEDDTDEFPVPVPLQEEAGEAAAFGEADDDTAEVVGVVAAIGAVHAVGDAVETEEVPSGGEESKTDAEAEVDEVESFDDFTGEQYVQTATREHVDFAAAMAEAEDEDTQRVALAVSMPGLDSGVVGFDDVVEAEGTYAGSGAAPQASNLLLRVGSAVFLIAVFLLSLLWRPGLTVLAIGVFVVAAGEFYTMLMQKGFKPLTLFGFLGIIGASLGAVFWDVVAIPMALSLLALVILIFFAVVPGRPKPLVSFSVTVAVASWVVLGAYAFPIIEAENYKTLVLAVVAAVALMDIASYFVGKFLGRNQLAPVVSPKKTWEGLVGGVMVVLLFGAILGYLEVVPFDLASGLVLGAVVAVVAPLGDLAVSVVKRTLAVKDMGALLPGHGGLFDRIDALLFVIPAAWVCYLWLGFI